MIDDKHGRFLRVVHDYVAENPEVSAYIGEAVAQGIRSAFDAAKTRAADFELMLACSLNIADGENAEHSEKLLKGLLEKWSGKTALRWDWVEERLKGSIDASACESRCEEKVESGDCSVVQQDSIQCADVAIDASSGAPRDADLKHD